MDPVYIGSESEANKHEAPKWKQMVNNNHKEKKTVIEDEMKRMNTLPPNSSYASHRLRVLNKILHLLSLQRTTSQDEELELLFAGLHL